MFTPLTDLADWNYLSDECFRLRERVRGAVLGVVAAEPVPEGVRVLLCALPLRAAGHRRQPPHVPLLRRHHHPRRPPQVPLIPEAGSLLRTNKLSWMRRVCRNEQ